MQVQVLSPAHMKERFPNDWNKVATIFGVTAAMVATTGVGAASGSTELVAVGIAGGGICTFKFAYTLAEIWEEQRSTQLSENDDIIGQSEDA